MKMGCSLQFWIKSSFRQSEGYDRCTVDILVQRHAHSKKVLNIFGKRLVAYVAFGRSTDPSMFTLHAMNVCINFPFKQLTQSKQQQQPQTH
jgi:hypothetical protein